MMSLVSCTYVHKINRYRFKNEACTLNIKKKCDGD
jgi:hypothetical protein